VVGQPPFFGRPAMPWPPLNSYFHPPLHLAPIMVTPLTKIIKSKANPFHPLPMFFLFIYLFEIFRFYIMQ
jgi:hypothetical protein